MSIARSRTEGRRCIAAAGNGNKAIAELLLKAGAAVNAKDEDGEHRSTLPLGARQPELAELLLANKADPNAKYNDGWTPLHLAVRDNQPGIVELLLANKADPNERNNAGQTPLDLAKSQAQSAQGQPPGVCQDTQSRGHAPAMPLRSAPPANQWQARNPGRRPGARVEARNDGRPAAPARRSGRPA